VKLKAVLLLIGFAALLPAGANASGAHGSVIGKQHGLLLVARPSGLVATVAARAAIGSRLLGTRVVGHAARARIHGIVVKRIGTTTILSSNRHLVAVHARRVVSAANTPAPAPGSVVDTTVKVDDDGELEIENENEVGAVNGPIQIQATVTAVAAGTVTLSVNGQSFILNLPAGLTLPASLVNQTVTLTVDVRADDNDDQGDDDHGGDHHGHGGGDDD
jgi:hypothetical protein